MINDLGRNSYDIAANVLAVERAKSRMLSDMARVFEIMAGENADGLIEDSLADLILNAYLLSAKMGIDFAVLDNIAVNKLKLLIINDETGIFPYAELKNRLSIR
ncbi:MAG: MazG-like family protein [Clostridiales bacterium]|jgi:hypothetical protein|nr:MazG-like family protein [Clostridiales bacterium]